MGDFVGPGQEQAQEAQANADNGGVGGASQSSSSGNPTSSNSTTSSSNGNAAGGGVNNPTPTLAFRVGSLIASATFEGGSVLDPSSEVASYTESADGQNTQTASDGIVSINLAWLIFLVPAYFAIVIIRKRRKLLRLLPIK